MALDLHKGARPDEHFYLQTGQPFATVKRFIIGRQVIWHGLTL